MESKRRSRCCSKRCNITQSPLHAYRDGRLEEVVLRHLGAEDGNTVIAKDISLKSSSMCPAKNYKVDGSRVLLLR
ncbi:hypothetical protein SASPL_106773 [Salvia splendens]|uniref:Uncharacterized protein n=1 Tax=Salvia splendens TaxID=180675 RepID=A0A8X9A9W3_SALSN|nr:hypothetical protein SASPL_106773 [Salvia splendens]